MKFSQNYHDHQIVEWADMYMNYGALKQMCKGTAEGVNFQELVAHCIAAIDSVQHFYHNTYTILLSKLSHRAKYQGRHDTTDLNPTGLLNLDELDHLELHHHKAAIIERIAEVDKLRWYGRVNTDAFRKIIRKIDSLSRDESTIAAQAEEYLLKSEFSTQAQCLKILESLNKALTGTAQAWQEISKHPSSIQQVFCTRIARVDPSISALRILRAIESDNSVELGKLIDVICNGDLHFSRLQFLQVLFECSIQCFSKSSWVDVLVSHAISLDAVPAIEDCLRDVVIKLGRGLSAKQQITPSDHKPYLSLLTYILDRSLAKGLYLLHNQDYLGRTPLHYACEYGLADVCEVFLGSMKARDLSGANDSRSVILLHDIQSRSPLHLSVLGGYREVTRLLIQFSVRNDNNQNETFIAHLNTVASELLLFAVRSNSAETLTSLLDTDIDINCCDALGQTPLYLAARSGNEVIINLLLPYRPLLDQYETVKNWTPLIIASSQGFSAIAKILIKHGANVEHRDRLGWTAVDHASYRGHLSLAKALVETTKKLNHKQAMEIHLKTSLQHKTLSRRQPRSTSSAWESHIIVNLGSLDLSDTTPAVRLSPHLIGNPSLMHTESLFSLGVSISGGASPCNIIPLPPLEDTTNIPWIFTTADPTDAKLTFELFRIDPAVTEGRELIGRGMSLMDSFKRFSLIKRESLNRDYTVPILSTATLEHIGAVTFSFIISTPLVLPNTPLTTTEELRFKNGPSKVIGHRGLGQNVLPSTRLQIGENTIQSFVSAADLGASHVELDVQLTKDYVPVIYHDFLVSETGIDIPMHNITYEQFMHISNKQCGRQMPTSPINDRPKYFGTPLQRRMRALSSSHHDDVETKDLKDRVKYTFDYNTRGYKGNIRGDFIHEAFVTLEQLLTQLPLHIGMDIEVKYPFLSEASDVWNMDPFFIEANFFTDTILLCLSKDTSTRSIFLSSFSPHICILLALKQSRWPVFFCTDSGNWQPTDVRATTLQEGLRFAKRWNLEGLVLASEPFVYAPQLAGFVKGQGLVCATYGVLNDDAESIMIQGKIGVDIIIVNNVRLASETLAALEKAN